GQIRKKYIITGGSASINFFQQQYRSNNSDEKQIWKGYQIDVPISLGYFVVDRFAIGGNLSFFHYQNKSVYPEIPGLTITRFDYQYFSGPFFRYYLLDGKGDFSFLIDASYS